jgi:hypothetical protein
VLKHLSKLQDLPEPLRNRVFRKLFHIAEITRMNPVERDSYDQSLKEYRDMYLMENALKTKDAIIRKQGAALRKHEAALKRKDAALEKHEADLRKQGADLKKHEASLRKQGADLKKQDARLRNSARILLEAGIDMQQISESTGLSIAEIEKIGKGVKQ